MRKVVWIIIILLALLVSVMSFMYLFDGVNEGYLELKSKEVLKSRLWWSFLYTHIVTVGIAIVIGWIQFSKRMQTTYVKWHRTLGKIYVVMALLCAISGFYIGFFATGGWIPATGFIAMALIYFYTTLQGFLAIKNKQITAHQNYMTYSYAACLAAVTLRIYIPLSFVLEIDYILAYSIIAWVSWIPNLAIAWWVNKRREKTNISFLHLINVILYR
ncbi:MAG: DUF2306 domain-containing protein [Saprospiraceae bacterium]